MRNEDEFKQAVDAVTAAVRDFRLSQFPQPGSSNIQVNGGGIGVWIATVCCALMLGISVVGAMVILDQNRQISDLRDHLTVIYAQAPHLKPEIKD